ncbi:hypothetical protein Tsubulata_022679 [Turnera subulata]|uniref:Neoxanthin synthase n=1 Tax=Turnera subulata TaxID=218843 RepID=A0A9Q0F842_9ROSI|nr:hypothetical protein Tsubulata_022679 [Turnera subulata]
MQVPNLPPANVSPLASQAKPKDNDKVRFLWLLYHWQSSYPNEEEATTTALGFLSFSPVMALSALFVHSHIPTQVNCSSNTTIRSRLIVPKDPNFPSSFSSRSTEVLGLGRTGTSLLTDRSVLRGSRTIIQPNNARPFNHRSRFQIRASWMTSTQIASSVFGLGTVAVLPFYTLMVVAPKAELTRKSMESTLPYVVLGLLYAFLLYLSWTPETIRLIFGGKYFLPELPAIAKMFSSEMTLASAWIHLLAIDLFAARQVFHDGLANEIETRHSISLCLLFCPIGVFTHVITKALTRGAGSTKHYM